MRNEAHDGVMPLALLAAASGARTWAGLAAIAKPTRAFAAVELIYDKVPTVPSRVAPASLAGRVAAGAIVGAMVGGRVGRSRTGSALFGGLIAFASAHATYRLRRSLGKRLPPVAAALVEDAIVVGAALTGATLLRSNGVAGTPTAFRMSR
jgi:uncharacterized membrane protein